jgi:hypothetical protein
MCSFPIRPSMIIEGSKKLTKPTLQLEAIQSDTVWLKLLYADTHFMALQCTCLSLSPSTPPQLTFSSHCSYLPIPLIWNFTLHLNPEKGSSIFLWNAGIQPRDDRAPKPTSPRIYSLLWKRKTTEKIEFHRHISCTPLSNEINIQRWQCQTPFHFYAAIYLGFRDYET